MEKGQMIHVAIGALLKAKREESGQPQIEIANRLNYRNKNLISMIESGRANLPIKRIGNFAVAYGFLPGEVLVFIKSLMPEVWSAFIMGLGAKEGEETSKKLDEETTKTFEKLMKRYELSQYLNHL